MAQSDSVLPSDWEGWRGKTATPGEHSLLPGSTCALSRSSRLSSGLVFQGRAWPPLTALNLLQHMPSSFSIQLPNVNIRVSEQLFYYTALFYTVIPLTQNTSPHAEQVSFRVGGFDKRLLISSFLRGQRLRTQTQEPTSLDLTLSSAIYQSLAFGKSLNLLCFCCLPYKLAKTIVPTSKGCRGD